MVADMHRLEQAARLSMGNFPDPEAPAIAAKRNPLFSLRYAAGTLVALTVFIAVYQLL